MSPTSLRCPYCRSRIPTRAEVCRYCTREVRPLLRARRRIRELEKELAELQSRSSAPASAPAPPDPRPIPRLLPRLLRGRRSTAVVWGYYAISALAIRFVSPSAMWDMTILIGLGMVAGVLFARNDRRSNAWMLAIYGAALPLFMTAAFTVLGRVTMAEFVGELPDFFKMAALTAASVVAGGAGYALMNASRYPPRQFFAPMGITALIVRSEEGVDRVHKLAMTLGSLITMLGAVYAFFFGGP